MDGDSEQVKVAFKLTKDEFEEFIKLCNTLDKTCDQPLGDMVLRAMRLYVKAYVREVRRDRKWETRQ